MQPPSFLSSLSPLVLALGTALAALPAWAQQKPAAPAAASGLDPADTELRPGESRPVAWELNWTPLRTSTGASLSLLGASAMVAVNDDWGLGPAFYGSAKGNFGGLFVLGLNAQRRWRLSPETHLAAGMFIGGGGGVSSPDLRFGGGLMLRPELSIRTEVGRWYSGVGVSHVRFPGGNISDTQLSFSIGHMGSFGSFDPPLGDFLGSTRVRNGLGFDEISLSAGGYAPRAGAVGRDGQPLNRHLGLAGADVRQYITPGAWWGLEASGAAKGGADGYMEVFGTIGQDWALGSSGVRLGGEAALGLGGGGNVDTGSGWLARFGPSLRWQGDSGLGLRLEGGWLKSRGSFSAPYVRLSLSLPLEPLRRRAEGDALLSGEVHGEQMMVSWQHLDRVRFKDGSTGGITQQGLIVSRELTPMIYGVAQAGAAVQGQAGAYAYGLFGLGLQTPLMFEDHWRVGAELLAGAGGGGGVELGSGALRQGELWAQWQGRGDLQRLRCRIGVGQWQGLKGDGPSSSLLNLSVGYAWGSL